MSITLSDGVYEEIIATLKCAHADLCENLAYWDGESPNSEADTVKEIEQLFDSLGVEYDGYDWCAWEDEEDDDDGE